MAYTRRRPARKAGYRSTARPRARARSGAGRSTRRAAPRSRASSPQRTIRIVIEQPGLNPVARPALGLMAAPRPRRPAFN